MLRNTDPHPQAKLTPEERRKASYRFIAGVLEASDVTDLPDDVREEVGRFIRTVAAAGAMQPTVEVPDMPIAKQPSISTPNIATVATMKANGSNGAH